jgi:lysozyme
MTLADDLKKMLIRHEGVRDRLYYDTQGIPTIGCGHNLTVPISNKAIQQIFEDDVADAYNDCLHAFPWFAELTEPRQWVLINMRFNLGLHRLQGFTKMLKALASEDYDTAANEMLASLWAKQVKSRALELATLMRGDHEPT